MAKVTNSETGKSWKFPAFVQNCIKLSSLLNRELFVLQLGRGNNDIDVILHFSSENFFDINFSYSHSSMRCCILLKKSK